VILIKPVRQEMKTITQSLLLLLVSLIVVSCGMPDIRIKRKVTESEIQGMWILDLKSSALASDNSIDRYEDASAKVHKITFNADGTCHYQSVLQMPTRYVDAHGTWEIGSDPDNPRGSVIDIRLKSDAEGTYMFSLDLKEDSGELILWEFWGDPDSWRFLEYNRKAEQGVGGQPATPPRVGD
jgi:hypothetical protein